MTREASGTTWQPDTSQHSGPMIHTGGWMLMAHGNVDLIGDWQGGPRGDDKVFVAGMLMGMAKRHIVNAFVDQKFVGFIASVTAADLE